MVQMIAPQMGGGAGGAEAGAAGSDAAAGGGESSPRAREYSLDELRRMPVRELKKLLHAHGVSEVEVVEKEELVQVPPHHRAPPHPSPPTLARPSTPTPQSLPLAPHPALAPNLHPPLNTSPDPQLFVYGLFNWLSNVSNI